MAILGDVESMFYQVRVPETQRNYLRYLWWPNGDVSKPLSEFRLSVHLFGAVSSPSVCNYALRKTEEDNSEDFSQSARCSVFRNFYVDDLLKSVATVEEALDLQQELVKLLAKGGFKLCKFVTNKVGVLQGLPPEQRARSVQEVDLSADNVEDRALGLLWNVSGDFFGISICRQREMTTKRNLLSNISSIFDPLGMTAPAILPARLEFQRLASTPGLGWDDILPTHDMSTLLKWQSELALLKTLKVPRCFKSPNMRQITSAQLYHFSDASEQGYASVCFIRLEDTEGHVGVEFVAGKARVAPLKATSIPRLELAAAVLSAKQGASIGRELEYKNRRGVLLD